VSSRADLPCRDEERAPDDDDERAQVGGSAVELAARWATKPSYIAQHRRAALMAPGTAVAAAITVATPVRSTSPKAGWRPFVAIQ
jgi:hypothetical protein